MSIATLSGKDAGVLDPAVYADPVAESAAAASSGQLSVTFETSANTVRTWQDMKRAGSARWAQHDTHLSQPKREFLGPGLDEITLSVRLDMQLGIMPLEELATLRAMRDFGQVSAFVVGGELLGDFTVDGVSEDWRRTDNKGVAQLIIVDLTLKEYA